MRSLLISSFFLCAVAIQLVTAQTVYKNNNWIVGYNTQIQFNDTGITVSRTHDTIISPSVAISDSSGQTLFRLHYPPKKGSLNPGKIEMRDRHGELVPYKLLNGVYTNIYTLGTCFTSERCNFIIDSDNLLYYFATYNFDTQDCDFSDVDIYYSIINPKLRSDTGAFVNLNQRLSWFHSIAAINAVRHADGKSWWIVSHLQRSDSFATFLLKENMFWGPIYSKVSPDIGDLYPSVSRKDELIGEGTINFSLNGDKILFVNPTGGLMKICHVYDFDRCTGKVSNPQDLTTLFQDYIADSIGLTSNIITFFGGAFSPSGRYVYLASSTRVFKIDLSTPITRTTLWRSTLAPQTYDINGPCYCNLAPNGNIYCSKYFNVISTYPIDFCSNINEYINVIIDPDNPDTLGQFQYKGLRIGPGKCAAWGFPVDVNHTLGRSTAECIGYPPVYTAVESPLLNQHTYEIYPNPSTCNITLKANTGKLDGQLSFYNLSGQVVYQANISNDSTHEWNVSGLPSGIYYLRLADGTNEPFVQKVVVE